MPLKLLSSMRKAGKRNEAPEPTPAPPRERPAAKPRDYEPAEATPPEPDELLQLVQNERFGVILSKQQQWRGHAHEEPALRQAHLAIDEQYCMVPEGYASLPQTISDAPGAPEDDIETQPFLLARYAVTNSQFQKFVDSGAYQDLSLWPEDIWPHLIDFNDLTEQHGPRFWQDGRHDRRLAEHPVVGICFYEAAAYANWAGYRLPTEAEWQMAASWRIRSSAHVLRRYPWGDALDKRRCNIWATGIGKTVPVYEYESGATPNGIVQLVGNTWEWTNSDFEVADGSGRPVVGDMLMKSVRGGAYDTYFASQATSCFRTGLACLLRAHNVGFRCALSIAASGRAGHAKPEKK